MRRLRSEVRHTVCSVLPEHSTKVRKRKASALWLAPCRQANCQRKERTTMRCAAASRRRRPRIIVIFTAAAGGCSLPTPSAAPRLGLGGGCSSVGLAPFTLRRCHRPLLCVPPGSSGGRAAGRRTAWLTHPWRHAWRWSRKIRRESCALAQRRSNRLCGRRHTRGRKRSEFGLQISHPRIVAH